MLYAQKCREETESLDQGLIGGLAKMAVTFAAEKAASLQSSTKRAWYYVSP
jgi:hypothetical protein